MGWATLAQHEAANATLSYYLYHPSRASSTNSSSSSTDVPLVTWLHGGIFSNGPEKQQIDPIAKFFAALDRCYVLHPVAPTGVNWLSYYRNHPSPVRRFEERPTKLLTTLMHLIGWLRSFLTPRGMLVIGGASMGGYATWDLIMRHPRVFAVALPMCGGGDPSQAWRVSRDVKIWAFHAYTDEVVNVDASRNMFAGVVSARLQQEEERRVHAVVTDRLAETSILRSADGGRLRFTEYQHPHSHAVACWRLPQTVRGMTSWVFEGLGQRRPSAQASELWPVSTSGTRSSQKGSVHRPVSTGQKGMHQQKGSFMNASISASMLCVRATATQMASVGMQATWCDRKGNTSTTVWCSALCTAEQFHDG